MGGVGVGDVIDLDDPAFVLRITGHSPGSVGLYEALSAPQVGGDVVQDGYCFDNVYQSDPAPLSMHRPREFPVDVVCPAHGEHFGRFRIRSISNWTMSANAVWRI